MPRCTWAFMVVRGSGVFVCCHCGLIFLAGMFRAGTSRHNQRTDILKLCRRVSGRHVANMSPTSAAKGLLVPVLVAAPHLLADIHPQLPSTPLNRWGSANQQCQQEHYCNSSALPAVVLLLALVWHDHL